MNDADKRIEWKSRYDAWKTSGLIAAEWSRINDVKIHQMYYWIRKFREEEISTNEHQSKWLTVDVQEISSHDTGQESVLIHYGALSIEVRPGTDLKLLSDVVRVIQNTCYLTHIMNECSLHAEAPSSGNRLMFSTSASQNGSIRIPFPLVN